MAAAGLARNAAVARGSTAPAPPPRRAPSGSRGARNVQLISHAARAQQQCDLEGASGAPSTNTIAAAGPGSVSSSASSGQREAPQQQQQQQLRSAGGSPAAAVAPPPLLARAALQQLGAGGAGGGGLAAGALALGALLLALAPLEPAAAADAASSVHAGAGSLYDVAEGEEFWGNVAKYGRYFVTVMLGTGYVMVKPLLEAFKRPVSAALAVAALAGGSVLLKFTLQAMLGIDEPFAYEPGSVVPYS